MLTDRKKRFADEYLASFNAVESAEKAGYKKNNPKSLRVMASQLLKDIDVREYVDKKMKAVESELIIKQEEIMAYYSSCIRGEQTETTCFILKDGDKHGFSERIVEKQVAIKARDRIRSAEIMAKIFGMTNIENNGQEKPTIIIKNNIPKSDNEK